MLKLFIVLIIGIVIGYAISSIMHKSGFVGTLQVIESNELEQPYIFLELNKELDSLCEKKYVSMGVKVKHQTPQK